MLVSHVLPTRQDAMIRKEKDVCTSCTDGRNLPDESLAPDHRLRRVPMLLLSAHVVKMHAKIACTQATPYRTSWGNVREKWHVPRLSLTARVAKMRVKNVYEEERRVNDIQGRRSTYVPGSADVCVSRCYTRHQLPNAIYQTRH